MDETLKTLLAAAGSLDAPHVVDRVDVVDALIEQLPRLAELTSEEWDAKLTDVEDDVDELGEAADRAAARFEQAQRALETLKRFAERHGAVVTGRAGQETLFETRGRGSGGRDADGRHANAVAQADSTREAILQVMARRPQREWTPVAIGDDLVRYGRNVARSNVQVTLQRLATDGQVRKVGRGMYRLVPGAVVEADDGEVDDATAEEGLE